MKGRGSRPLLTHHTQGVGEAWAGPGAALCRGRGLGWPGLGEGARLLLRGSCLAVWWELFTGLLPPDSWGHPRRASDSQPPLPARGPAPTEQSSSPAGGRSLLVPDRKRRRAGVSPLDRPPRLSQKPVRAQECGFREGVWGQRDPGTNPWSLLVVGLGHATSHAPRLPSTWKGIL